MTPDRDFERVAAAWLANGPEEVSGRVLDSVADQIHLTRQRRAGRAPRRFPTMTTPTRVAAAAAIGVLAIGGAFFVLRPDRSAVVGPGASPPASATASARAVASPSASAVVLPALTQAYTSERNGFALSFPAGWTATPASATWTRGHLTGWGDPVFDTIRTTDIRLAVASQPLEPGQTLGAWQQATCELDTPAGACSEVIATQEKVDIDGAVGSRGANGERPPFTGVVADGVIFEAEVASGGRAFEFVMDGHVDRAMFDAFLRTVRFVPLETVDPPALTGIFTSPTYGYSIGLAKGWTTTPATTTWAGSGVNPTVVDTIAIPGTDTSITAASEPFPVGITFDDWLVQFHQRAIQDRPPGCDGGDPSTWVSIRIGTQAGRVAMGCNGAEALAIVNGRGYVFGMTNATTKVADHLGFAAWTELLNSVTFDPRSAK